MTTFLVIEESVRAAAERGWEYRAIFRQEEKVLWFGITWAHPQTHHESEEVPKPTRVINRVINRIQGAIAARFRRPALPTKSSMDAELTRLGVRLSSGGRLVDFYEVGVRSLYELARRFDIQWELRGTSIQKTRR